MQPIPTILGARIRLVGSRMRGGGLIVGEQFAEIHQAGHTAGGSAELDDLILHGIVVAAHFGGQQHDVSIGVHRVIVVQNIVGSKIIDLLQLAETVHRRHVVRGSGEPHEPVIVEQQTMRTIVEHGNLTAQHAVRIMKSCSSESLPSMAYRPSPKSSPESATTVCSSCTSSLPSREAPLCSKVCVRDLPSALVNVMVMVFFSRGIRPSIWNSWVLLYCDCW